RGLERRAVRRCPGQRRTFDRRAVGSVEVPLAGRNFIGRLPRYVVVAWFGRDFVRLLAGKVAVTPATIAAAVEQVAVLARAIETGGAGSGRIAVTLIVGQRGGILGTCAAVDGRRRGGWNVRPSIIGIGVGIAGHGLFPSTPFNVRHRRPVPAA